MSMIKCPECGKKISNKANSCPHCGCPIAVSKERTSPNENANKETVQTTSGQKKKRGCLIAVLAFFAIYLVIAIMAQFVPDNSETSESTIEETASQLSKEDAKAMDEEIWNYVLPIINANNDLMNVMANGSSLDIYNSAKSFYDLCQTTWGNAPEVSNEDGAKYLESCRDYILCEQTLSEKISDYIDSEKTSDLSEVQDAISRAQQAISIVAGNRGTFLSLNGFTDEEIAEITADMGIE